MAKRIPKVKSIFQPESLDACLRWCKISGKPYVISVSNYTTIIEGHLNVKFIKTEKSPACFIASHRIQSDIKKSNIHVDTQKDEVNYFDSCLRPIKSDKIFNLDLKSAYATILRNNKLITPATYNYLCELPKGDRLAAVGMLASHKYNFEYLHNDITDFTENKNAMESYFYFCVQKTFDIMQELKKICGDSYLFCWVDSVYYTDYSKTKLLTAYLRSIRFNSSFEILQNVEVNEKKNYFVVSFVKEGDTKEFKIPKSEGSFARDIISKYIKCKN